MPQCGHPEYAKWNQFHNYTAYSGSRVRLSVLARLGTRLPVSVIYMNAWPHKTSRPLIKPPSCNDITAAVSSRSNNIKHEIIGNELRLPRTVGCLDFSLGREGTPVPGPLDFSRFRSKSAKIAFWDPHRQPNLTTLRQMPSHPPVGGLSSCF